MTNHHSLRDKLFNSPTDLVDWTFDEAVTKVFDDMVVRSVPGYRHMIEMIALLSNHYALAQTNVYDLGCSTGVSSRALATSKADIHIHAVDNSPSMIEMAQQNLNDITNITYHTANIEDITIVNASIVVLNLTLQFINPEQRTQVLQSITNGMVSGGIIILSEKIQHHDPTLEELHIAFKRSNGYSELEIANKRQMLENSLITESLETHLERLAHVGLEARELSRYLNFSLLVGTKN